MTLDAKIESLLFWKGEPVAVKKLSAMLGVSEEEVRAALSELEKKLEGRGIELVQKSARPDHSDGDDEVMLGTHGEMSSIIETLTKEELTKDLGKAGLETLSIILYRGPATRRDIDYIRGVNSQFILRNLLIRGLVEKVQNPDDQRTFFYKPTFQLLSYLGLSKLEDLPGYLETKKELAAASEPEIKSENQDE